ncbi:MAG: hypothetical protein WD425_13370 [Nitrospirales bacterium]
MNITQEIEKELWTKAEVSRITDIPGFPFQNYNALIDAVTAGDARIGIEYSAARELVTISKSASASALILALSWVMPALAIGSVVVALVTGNWWALGGVVSSFLGQTFANPYIPVKGLGKLLVAGALIHILFAQSIIEGFTWVSFSFAVSAVALYTWNGLAWKWAIEAALASEAFAAYLFKTNNLHIIDNQGKFHDAQREE